MGTLQTKAATEFRPLDWLKPDQREAARRDAPEKTGLLTLSDQDRFRHATFQQTEEENRFLQELATSELAPGFPASRPRCSLLVFLRLLILAPSLR